jgi:hypothetical protein
MQTNIVGARPNPPLSPRNEDKPSQIIPNIAQSTLENPPLTASTTVDRRVESLSDWDQANCKLKEHEYQEALDLFKRILNPDFNTKLKIIECLCNLKQADEFKANVQSLEKEFQEEPLVRYWSCVVAILVDSNTQIGKIIDDLLLTFDHSHQIYPKLLCLQAHVMRDQKCCDSAELLQRHLNLLQLYPNNSDVVAYVFLALCSASSDFEHETAFPKNRVLITDKEIKILDRALKNDPKNPALLGAKRLYLILKIDEKEKAKKLEEKRGELEEKCRELEEGNRKLLWGTPQETQIAKEVGALLERANQHLADFDYAQALRCLAGIKTKNLEIKLKVIECCYHLEKNFRFERCVDTLLKEYPEELMTLYWGCVLIYNKKNFAEALDHIQILRNTISFEVVQPLDLLRKLSLLEARVKEASGSPFEELNELFADLLSTYSDNAEVVADVMIFYYTRPRLFEHLFGKGKVPAIVHGADNIKCLDAAIENHPDYPCLLLAKAMCAFHLGNDDYSLFLIDKSLNKLPSRYITLANLFKSLLFLRRGIRPTFRAEHAGPLSPFGDYLLGIINYLLLKNFRASLPQEERTYLTKNGPDIFKRIISTSQSKELLFSTLCAYSEFSKWTGLHLDAAIYLKLIELEPYSNANYYLFAGSSLISKAKYQETIEILERVIQKVNNPDSFSKFIHHRHYTMGNCQTIDEWKRTVLFGAYAALAQVYQNLEPKSLTHCEKAYAFLPITDSFMTLMSIDIAARYVTVLLLNNDWEKASQVLQEQKKFLFPSHEKKYSPYFSSCLSHVLEHNVNDATKIMNQLIHQIWESEPQKNVASPAPPLPLKDLPKPSKKSGVRKVVITEEDRALLLEQRREAEEREKALARKRMGNTAAKVGRNTQDQPSPVQFAAEISSSEAKVRFPRSKGLSKHEMKKKEIEDKLRKKAADQIQSEEVPPLRPPQAQPVAQPPAPQPVLEVIAPARKARERLVGPVAQTIDLRHLESSQFIEIKAERKDLIPPPTKVKKEVVPLSEALSTRLESAHECLILLEDLYKSSEDKEGLKFRLSAMYYIFKFSEYLCDTSSGSLQALRFSEILVTALESKGRIIEETMRRINLQLVQIAQGLAIQSESKDNLTLAREIHQFLKEHLLKPIHYYKINERLRELLMKYIPRGNKEVDKKIADALEEFPLQLSSKELEEIDARLVDLNNLDLIRNEVRSYFSFVSNSSLIQLVETLCKSSLRKNLVTWRETEGLADFDARVSELPLLCPPDQKEWWNQLMAQSNSEAHVLLFKLMRQNFQDMRKLIETKEDFREYWLKGETVRAACKMTLSNIRKCLVLFRDFGLLHRFENRNQKIAVSFKSLIEIGNRVGHHIENGKMISREDVSSGEVYDIARQSQAIRESIEEIQRMNFPETLPVVLQFRQDQIDQLRSFIVKNQIPRTKFVNLNLLGNIFKRFSTFDQFQRSEITKQMAISLLEGLKNDIGTLPAPMKEILNSYLNNMGEDNQQLYALIANAHLLLNHLFASPSSS